MEVVTDMVTIGKLFDTRREALNYIDAFHPEQAPRLSKVQLNSGEMKFLLEINKPVAVISGVEYSVIIIEDAKEGIENAE